MKDKPPELTIKNIDNFLEKFSEEDIDRRFNLKDLNKNEKEKKNEPIY